MKPRDKVVWGEGMFLTQHLFQQADRHHEHVLDLRLRALVPFGWGLTELQIDEEARRYARLLVDIREGHVDLVASGRYPTLNHALAGVRVEGEP